MQDKKSSYEMQAYVGGQEPISDLVASKPAKRPSAESTKDDKFWRPSASSPTDTACKLVLAPYRQSMTAGEIFCAALFYVFLLTTVVCSIVILAEGNRKSVTADCLLSETPCLDSACGDGYVWNPYEIPSSVYKNSEKKRDVYCVSEDLWADLLSEEQCAAVIPNAAPTPSSTSTPVVSPSPSPSPSPAPTTGSCTCPNGVPMIDYTCGMMQPSLQGGIGCSLCNAGYALDISNYQCVANIGGGTPAPSPAPTATCTCPNGTPLTDSFCGMYTSMGSLTNGIGCDYCDPNYAVSQATMQCVSSPGYGICTCPNGTPLTSSVCRSVYGTLTNGVGCGGCNIGYTRSNSPNLYQCVPDSASTSTSTVAPSTGCICPGGGAMGAYRCNYYAAVLSNGIGCDWCQWDYTLDMSNYQCVKNPRVLLSGEDVAPGGEEDDLQERGDAGHLRIRQLLQQVHELESHEDFKFLPSSYGEEELQQRAELEERHLQKRLQAKRLLQEARHLRRRLSASDDRKTVWETMAEQWEVPLISFLAFTWLLVLWLLALYYAPKVMIFGTIALGVIAMIALFCVDPKHLWYLLIPAVVVTVVTILYFKQVSEAADSASKAMSCLNKAKDVILFSMLQFLVFGGFLAFWLVGFIESGNWVEWRYTGTLIRHANPTNNSASLCELKTTSASVFCQTMLWLVFFPLVIFLRQVILIICTTGVANWTFHSGTAAKLYGNTPAIRNPGAVGFSMAYTTSAGVNMFASIIVSLTYEIRRRAENVAANPILCCCWNFGFCCTDLLCFALWMGIKCLVEPFTKYLVVGHTIHSGPICATAMKVFNLFQDDSNQGVLGLAVQDYALTSTFTVHRVLVATGMGMMAWVYMDNQIEQGVFGNDNFDVSVFVLFVLIILMWMFVIGLGFGPIFGLILLILIADWNAIKDLDENNVLHGLFTGIFVGCACAVIFQFVQMLIVYSTNAILYCHALLRSEGKEAGRDQRKSVKGLLGPADAPGATGEGIMTTNDLVSYDMKAANENMKNNLPKPMGSTFADPTNNSSTTASPDHKFHDAEGEAIEMAEIEVGGGDDDWHDDDWNYNHGSSYADDHYAGYGSSSYDAQGRGNRSGSQKRGRTSLDEASRKKRKPQALDDVQTGYYAGGYENSYDAAKVPAGTRSYRAGRQKSSRSADNAGRRLKKMQDASYDLETYAAEEPEHDAPQEPEHI
ncbi:unnamed protein product [Amoebophrya sp. A120]|nr:unnamed protein product [Amoebophrya sp. A120]|eukprot:GSA120T00024280001.1